MDVYLVCVLLNPTSKDREESGAVPKIVVQPQAVMAKDANQASMKAYRFVPDEYSAMEDRLEVRLLPFRPAK